MSRIFPSLSLSLSFFFSLLRVEENGINPLGFASSQSEFLLVPTIGEVEIRRQRKRRARQIPLDKEERLGWMELIKGGLAPTGFLDKNN